MELKTKAEDLIANGKFDDVEELWMESLDEMSVAVEEYLSIGQKLRKAGERSRSDALLDLLADTLGENDLWADRVRVLREIGRLSKRPSLLREPLEEAVTKSLGDRPSFDRVMKVVDFGEKDSNPVDKAAKVMTWLRFDVESTFFMAGRGCGVVTELNAELGLCRLDFPEIKRVSVPLGAASKHLEPIGDDHFLKGHFDDPGDFLATLLKNQADSLEKLLRSFGRPLTGSEVKDAFRGIIPANKWSSWWTSARKHPQIVATGSGAKATYQWKASSEAADAAILAKFDKASVKQKREIARKQSGRNQELADHFASVLVEVAESLEKSSPSEVWEIFSTLEKLPGNWESTIDPASLVTGPGAARVISSVGDRSFREKALDTMREQDPNWVSAFAEVFFAEEDPRVMTRIISELEDGGATEVVGRLAEETLRYPRRHPHAFGWYLENVTAGERLPDRVSYSTAFQVLDALGTPEFASLKGRLKEMFDRGGLVIRVVMEVDNLEQARKLAEAVERSGELEPYRRQTVHSAVTMKHPSLRESDHEPILATAKSVEEKRKEFDHLKKVEIPANLKAIQEARELGDLSENFEYKSARQRQEYLSARASALDGELQRVRILDPAAIDPGEIRVGTRVVLRNGDVEREVMILGPWESDPERGVYSHESDVAKALIGRREGDVASFLGNDYLVGGIRRWTE